MKQEKAKSETAVTETNAAFTVRVTVIHPQTRVIYTQESQTVFKGLKDENSAVWKNVGTRACSLAMI